MPAPSAFVDSVLGGLLPLGPVRARAMFGGWGLFLDDVMFGLIAGEQLYYKVDAETQPRFAATGAKAFTYLRQGKMIALSYWEAPLEPSLEAPLGASGPAALLAWAELGLAAATRARDLRRSKGRRR
jgi:DNA transformation protein